MNTKFFLLLLIALLVANPTSSVINNKQRDVTPVNTESSSETTTPNKEHRNTQNLPWMLDWSTTHTVDHHPDDDCKFHHFHFNRFRAIRRRKLLCVFLTKLVLAIIHLSCFIYGFAFLIH